MRSLPKYQHPTTYAEIVRAEHARHERRLAELKRAEKMIRALEGDFADLVKAGQFYGVDELSMYLQDYRWIGTNPSKRARWALHLSAGVFSESEGRLITALIERGWTVDAVDTRNRYGSVLLRKTKCRALICINANSDFLKTLQPTRTVEAVEEAA